jgi:hypothetical protein
MVSVKENNSPSRFIRSIKGVKLLLGRGDQQQKRQQKNSQDAYAKEGVAVTLTTEFDGSDQGDPTLLHPNTTFVPSQPVLSSSFDSRAYVHYEPKLSQVTLGTSPDRKNNKLIKLSVDQYTWLIQQFREEQNVHDVLLNFFELNKSEKSEFEQPFTISPMLGVINVQNHTKSFSQRLIRFVQRRTVPDIYGQCIYTLPKALLLQAAAYIPSKNPSFATSSINTHLLLNPPFKATDDEYHKRLLRYCSYIPLCQHDLSLGEKQDTLSPIVCSNCSLKTTLYQQQRQQLQPVSKFSSFMEEPVMFPLSYHQYPIINNPLLLNNTSGTHGNNESLFINTASAIPPQRRAFGSFSSNEKPHAYSAFQYIPPERTISNSTSSISDFSGIIEEEEEDLEKENQASDPDERTNALEKHGFVAVDDEHEEIIVAFPGITVSHSMLKNASFVPVPWTEVLESPKLKQSHAEYISTGNNGKRNKKNGSDQDEYQENTEQDQTHWVLDCALTAWRRCEMRVVTLLMRLCSTMPSHYKVTIVGYSVGGGTFKKN